MSRTREKRSFTLSPEAMLVLAEFQTQTKAGSLSAALEKLLQLHQAQRNKAALDASIARYYDGLTDEAVAEEREWGGYASTQFAASREAEEA